MPVGINEKGFVNSNSWMFLLKNYCIEIRGGSIGTPLWLVLINILSKSSKIVHFSQICYTFMSCSVIPYQIDVVVVLIISQLLSKTCNVILSAPRSWRQVCAICNLRKSLRLLTKVRIAQTCLHDLGANKMTLQFCWEAEKWWVQQQHQSDKE